MADEDSTRYLRRIIKYHRDDSETFQLSSEEHLKVAHKLKYGEFENYLAYRRYCTQNGLAFYGKKSFYDYLLTLDDQAICG